MEVNTYHIIDSDTSGVSQITMYIGGNFTQIDVLSFLTIIRESQTYLNRLQPDILIITIPENQSETLDLIASMHLTAPLIYIGNNPNLAYVAFRYNATYFLLKPLSFLLLDEAVTKCIKQIRLDFLAKNAIALHSFFRLNYLFIPTLDSHEIIPIKEIVYFFIKSKHTTFVLANKREITSSTPFKHYDYFFNTKPYFYKVSRSTVVHFTYVTKLLIQDGYYCVFANQLKVTISKRKYFELKDLLT